MGIFAKKSLGQNFLVNKGILDKIVATAEITKNDTVLEIGPGTGVLTEKLAQVAGQVIAIEKDRRLTAGLQEKFKNTNVEIVEGDILKLNVWTLFRNLKLEIRNSHYKVVGNIPYYITSHLLKTVLERWPTPELIVLMIQKEVAQRILAKPPHMNLLALSVQFYAEPKIISYVSRGSFRPIPKVDSAIISLRPKALSLKPELKKEFFKLTRTAFAGKRKQLVGNLSKNFGIIRQDLLKIFDKVGIRPDARAENLSLEQWIKLSKYIDT